MLEIPKCLVSVVLARRMQVCSLGRDSSKGTFWARRSAIWYERPVLCWVVRERHPLGTSGPPLGRAVFFSTFFPPLIFFSFFFLKLTDFLNKTRKMQFGKVPWIWPCLILRGAVMEGIHELCGWEDSSTWDRFGPSSPATPGCPP